LPPHASTSTLEHGNFGTFGKQGMIVASKEKPGLFGSYIKLLLPTSTPPASSMKYSPVRLAETWLKD